MTSTKLGDIITHRYNFSKLEQQPLFDDFARYRKLWESKIDDDPDWPWDYTLFNPLVFSTLRSFVARVATGNLGVTLQAWNEQGRPKAALNKALLDWEFQEAQLFLHMARAMFSVGLYGKGFLRTGWCFKKARVIEEVDAQGNVTRRLTMSPTVNRADLATVRVYDVLIANRNQPELQLQPWIILQQWKTLGDLEDYNEQQGREVYKNLKKIREKRPFTRYVDYGSNVKFADDDEELRSGLIPVLEMWDRQTGQVTEVIRDEKEFVLRDEDNPNYHGEYPLVDLTFFPEDDNFWSTGLVRPMEDLQIADNSVLNQYMTNARQQLNNMWIAGDTRIPDWEFVSRPNGVIHVAGDINQLREVQHKDISGQAQVMREAFKQDIQRTTGINDFLAMGAPAGGVKAVGALQLEQSNLDQNLKLFMTMVEQVTLQRLVTQVLKLNQQYITSEQMIGISGRHGYKNQSIKPDDVSAEFTPVVIPNSTLPKNPVIRLQNLENLKAQADSEKQVRIDKGPIWREMIATMGMTDLDEIVPSDRDEALEENDLLKKGIPVECEVNDDHAVHIAVHQFELLKGQLEPAQAQAIVEHIKTHKLWQLAQDPQLLDKLQAPAPGVQPSGLPTVPTPGLPAGPAPTAELPQPNAAVDEQGLINQIGQELGQATATAQQGPIRQLGGDLSGA